MVSSKTNPMSNTWSKEVGLLEDVVGESEIHGVIKSDQTK
jgi:hypothetical protein